MMAIVKFLWIVPCTETLAAILSGSWQDKFTFLDLLQNFRNSREIVKTTKLYAEEKSYTYEEGIAMPLGNFPTGCTPIFVHTFEDAMKEARKRTKDGILVINRVTSYINGDCLNQMKEKWKVYHRDQNDFIIAV